MRRKDKAEVCPAHTMKEVSGQLHVPVTFHLSPPRERTPITQRLGGWVGLRASLAFWTREKSLASAGNWSLDHPAIQMIVTHSWIYFFRWFQIISDPWTH